MISVLAASYFSSKVMPAFSASVSRHLSGRSDPPAVVVDAFDAGVAGRDECEFGTDFLPDFK